jgi:hypothetical protein
MFQRTLRREEDQLRSVQVCPICRCDPGYVLERGEADDALQLTDELMIWLPPNFTLAENKELLDNIVEFIAPQLGWRPAEAALVPRSRRPSSAEPGGDAQAGNPR